MVNKISIIAVIILSFITISCSMPKTQSIEPTPTTSATLDITTTDCSRLMKMWFLDLTPFIDSWKRAANESLDNKDKIDELQLLLSDFRDFVVPTCGQYAKQLYITALESDIDVLVAFWEHSLSKSEFEALVNIQATNYEAFQMEFERRIGPLGTVTPLAQEWPTVAPDSTASPNENCEVAALAWSAVAQPMVSKWNDLKLEVLEDPNRLPELVQLKQDIDAIPALGCVQLAKSLLSESMEYIIEATTALIDNKASQADVYALLDKSDQKYDEFLIELQRIVNITE